MAYQGVPKRYLVSLDGPKYRQSSTLSRGFLQTRNLEGPEPTYKR